MYLTYRQIFITVYNMEGYYTLSGDRSKTELFKLTVVSISVF